MLTGHAGLYVEAGGSSVLCDPWFGPAYFASWFPFPDNSTIDPASIGSPTYLYISHLHQDHFDASFLARHVQKDAIVLLPDFPLPELRHALERLGFHRFIETSHGVPVELDGIRVAISTATTPADGPLGDSTLAIDDGEVRLLDQNDCRPCELGPLQVLGPVDLHLLQYSGAIWYPESYVLDPEVKQRLGRQKRLTQMARAFHYVEQIGAEHVVPFAGPPAFLDDDLFDLNDVEDDAANIFVDQRGFLRYLADREVDRAHLMIPGSVAVIVPESLDIEHPVDPDELDAMFSAKSSYLEAYRARRRPQIAEALAACPDTGPDIVAALASWWGPLLDSAPRVCARLGGPIVLELGVDTVVIDPARRQVRRWRGEEWHHRFTIDHRLVRSLVARRVADWVNELFLSCRFEVERAGPYNGTVFSFFKCLSAERMTYLEESLAASPPAVDAEHEVWWCGDRLVQRRCPHLGADLARFGEVEDGILTCTVHGWRFDLASGACLSAEGAGLMTSPGSLSGR